MSEGNGEVRGTNSFDKETAQSFVDRLLNLHADLATERGTYMATCKGIREVMKDVVAEAKDSGIAAKALKGFIKATLLEDKIVAIRDHMDDQDQLDYDHLQQVLGVLSDTPLGQAALNAVQSAA